MYRLLLKPKPVVGPSLGCSQYKHFASIRIEIYVLITERTSVFWSVSQSERVFA